MLFMAYWNHKTLTWTHPRIYIEWNSYWGRNIFANSCNREIPHSADLQRYWTPVPIISSQHNIVHKGRGLEKAIMEYHNSKSLILDRFTWLVLSAPSEFSWPEIILWKKNGWVKANSLPLPHILKLYYFHDFVIGVFSDRWIVLMPLSWILVKNWCKFSRMTLLALHKMAISDICLFLCFGWRSLTRISLKKSEMKFYFSLNISEEKLRRVSLFKKYQPRILAFKQSSCDSIISEQKYIITIIHSMPILI